MDKTMTATEYLATYGYAAGGTHVVRGQIFGGNDCILQRCRTAQSAEKARSRFGNKRTTYTNVHVVTVAASAEVVA
jgi:hypothetical protein